MQIDKFLHMMVFLISEIVKLLLIKNIKLSMIKISNKYYIALLLYRLHIYFQQRTSMGFH